MTMHRSYSSPVLVFNTCLSTSLFNIREYLPTQVFALFFFFFATGFTCQLCLCPLCSASLSLLHSPQEDKRWNSFLGMPVFWIMTLLPCFYVQTPSLFVHAILSHCSCFTHYLGLRNEWQGAESETGFMAWSWKGSVVQVYSGQCPYYFFKSYGFIRQGYPKGAVRY